MFFFKLLSNEIPHYQIEGSNTEDYTIAIMPNSAKDRGHCNNNKPLDDSCHAVVDQDLLLCKWDH